MKFYNDKFKELRKKNRFSTLEFCRKANISRSSLWNWEKGKQAPSEVNVRNFASILRAPVSDISDLEANISENKDEFKKSVASVIGVGISGLEDIQKNSGRILKEIKSQTDLISKIVVVFNALMSSVEFILYMKDADNKYIIANEAFLNNLGLPRDYRVLGLSDDSFFSKEEAEINRIEDFEIIKSGQKTSHERHILGSRKKRWGIVSKYPIMDGDGRCMGVIGIINDITSRKKAEERRKLLEYAMNKTEDTLFWMGKYTEKNKLKYLFVSDGVEKVFKMDVKTFVATDYKDLLTDEYKHLVDMKFDSYPAQGEYKAIRGDGEIRLMHETAYKDGDVYLGLIKDVTDRSYVETTRKLVDVLFTEELGYVYSILERTKDGTKHLFSSGSEENIKKICGYSSVDFAADSKFLEKIIHPDDVKNTLKEMFDEKIRKKIEFKVVKKDGSVGVVKSHIIMHCLGERIFYLILFQEGF